MAECGCGAEAGSGQQGRAGHRRQESRDPGTHRREEGTMMGRRQCRGYLLIWAHRRVTGTDIAGGEAPSVLSTVYPDTEIVSILEYLYRVIFNFCPLMINV